MDTYLYLVRHGQTDLDKKGILHSTMDCGLNEKGESEAKLLANVLSHHPISCVYSSNLRRALETAKPIAKACKCEVRTEKSLSEKKLGKAEGMHISEYQNIFMDALLRHSEMNFYERLFNKIVDDSESHIDLAERILPTIHALCEQHPDEHLVIVTHDWVLKILMILIGKFDESSIEIESGAVVEMKGNGKELAILSTQGVCAEKLQAGEL